ncbi:uncharacterized protein N7484_002650 [Penicillium longicatenatum]|uniref:uncharacterized protein n=1 Tax=Penicillium longicatenatum TaxID=1561947 RepID=UPI002548F107|nr:uncharacterized protein N7484_002650 [Penicillium longicatenatum]KAJ5648927.1 hypothetical protein N7484_002650 [Penicillium longicatenatum]
MDPRKSSGPIIKVNPVSALASRRGKNLNAGGSFRRRRSITSDEACIVLATRLRISAMYNMKHVRAMGNKMSLDGNKQRAMGIREFPL